MSSLLLRSTRVSTSLKPSTCHTGWTLRNNSTYSPGYAWFVGLICTRRKLQSVLASVTSDLLPTSVVDLWTSFRRRLVKFRQAQVRHQPEVVRLLAQLPETGTGIDAVQDIPLFLPSSLPRNVLVNCSKRLVSMEAELRISQCRDSLVQLRTKLTTQARLLKYKYIHVRHQASNTRSRNLINRVNAKIEATATKYRRAFTALNALDPEGKFGWRSELLELRSQDIRGISQAELPDAPTKERTKELQKRRLLNGKVAPKGNRTVSWVWRGSLMGSFEDQRESKEYGEGLN